MRFSTALLSALSAAAQLNHAHAGGLPDATSHAARRPHTRDAGFHEKLRREAFHVVERLDRRQSTASPPSMANSPTEADINAWNMQTEQACMGSLMNLKGLASNQAGMAVCYNLPFLDPATGVFEAELRMFNVSPPINEWVGVAPLDIMVTLSYLGATVQKANGALQRRAVDDPSKLVERQTTMPQQLKVLTYVGQINSNLRGSQMNLYVHLLHMTMLADTRRAGHSYSRCLSHRSI